MDCGKVSASGCNMDFPTMERSTHYLTGELLLIPIIPIKRGLEGLFSFTEISFLVLLCVPSFMGK